LFLVGFVAIATFDPSPRMPGFQGPMFLLLAAVGWPLLGWRIARWRRSGERPPMSIPGLVLTTAAMTVLAIPALLWPQWPDTEALPPLVSATTRLCWCAAGLLEAVGIYLILSYTRRPSTGRTS
jgi:hypothetical protein